jgi:hypothetical protein
LIVGALLISEILAALILRRPSSALNGGGESSARYRWPRVGVLVGALWGANLLVVWGGTAVTLAGVFLAVLPVVGLITERRSNSRSARR